MKGFNGDDARAEGCRWQLPGGALGTGRLRVAGRIGAGLLSAAALATALAVASPAQAAPVTCDEGDPCETTTTFVIEAGTLTITVPDAVLIGDPTPPGGEISGAMGVITVNDERASPTPDWTASVIATDFTTGGADDPGEIVPVASITYTSGTVTPGAGQTGTCAGSAEAALDDTTPLPVVTHTGGTGNNTCSWNPTLTITLTNSNVAGTYTGTVTHSVAGA
jgi:hypothetical protein